MAKQVKDCRIVLVAAEWHEEFVGKATASCQKELKRLGVNAKNVKLIKVPGSLELPLTAKLLAQSGEWDAVIAFGLVVDEGIYRHEFVAQTVLDGLINSSLETGVPILSAVLTPQRFSGSDPKYRAFLQQHLLGKGSGVAQSAIKIIQTTDSLRK